eukprot:11643159-Alexandrium_andersonii.AAC.1
MSASLVGSEMCIRDRLRGPFGNALPTDPDAVSQILAGLPPPLRTSRVLGCLLYTSDAADDM